MSKHRILNIGYDDVSLDDLTCQVGESIRSRRGMVIYAAPTHSVVESLNDGEFRDALNNANIVLPDGIGILLAARALGVRIRRRITGPDFFGECTSSINRNGGCKYYFMGADNKTLDNIRIRMAREYRNINIVGMASPSFGEMTDDESRFHIENINASDADVLWVGMTAPKQEKWIYRNREKLNVPVIAGIGAAFDFFAGTKKRCPKYLRDLGLEWFVRWTREPRRLWKRVFVSNPKFLYYVFKDMFKGRLS